MTQKSNDVPAWLTHEDPYAIAARLKRSIPQDDLLVDLLEADGTRTHLKWLREHRPAAFDGAICAMHDIVCYRVGDSCFADSAPAEEQDMWFVSTLANSALDLTNIPLAQSLREAEHAAAQAVLAWRAMQYD